MRFTQLATALALSGAISAVPTRFVNPTSRYETGLTVLFQQ